MSDYRFKDLARDVRNGPPAMKARAAVLAIFIPLCVIIAAVVIAIIASGMH